MKYQLLPRLSPEEFASLERSIIAHGVLVPVEYDEAGDIIDGHHRVEICESLGLVDWPRFVRKGLSETDKRTLSRELNFARRHLTTAQKQAVIADQLRDTPSISSRAVAAMLGVHHSTVQSVRKQLVDGGEISHHEEIEGRDGVVQPARKAIKTAFVPDGPNVGEYMKGAKIIRAEKQKLVHAVRLTNMELIAERGRESAPASQALIYPVYYADPCWQYAVRSEVTGREKSAENHYPTMPTDEICTLMARLIGGGHPAVCFLWATNPMLLDGLRVLDACGFTYVHHWVWDKEVAGTGYWGRDRHEILLIGRRGDIAAPLPGTQPDTVHRERKGGHSAKPDWFAEQIEKLFPGLAKLELFARAARPGWDAWGFEVGDLPETASEKVGGVASACSALVSRRELDVNASENGVTGGESAATIPVANSGEGATCAIAAASVDPDSRGDDVEDRQRPALPGSTGGRQRGGVEPVSAEQDHAPSAKRRPRKAVPA